jgi:hypothetical protein
MSNLIHEIDLQQESQKDKNIKEWNRINNIWLDIKNKNKIENPSLYSTDSENSSENLLENVSSHSNNILKKSNSFCSYDDEISNSVMDAPCYEDEDVDEYTLHSVITPSSIKYKYSIENAASLELDYSINYNMKILTHIGTYYEILKSKNKSATTNNINAKGTKTRSNTIKMCKPELIKSIVSFETNDENHHIVYKCKKMLEYIELIKNDKYFASFVLFP